MDSRLDTSSGDSAESRSSLVEPRMPLGKRIRILIADDDPDARRLQQAFLEPLGDCDFAADGREAVQRVADALDESKPYDLVCLDIIMPNVDGREALRTIRALERAKCLRPGRAATIIMMTSVDDPETRFASFRDECDAYLIKPVDRAKLAAVLRRLGLTAPDP